MSTYLRTEQRASVSRVVVSSMKSVQLEKCQYKPSSKEGDARNIRERLQASGLVQDLANKGIESRHVPVHTSVDGQRLDVANTRVADKLRESAGANLVTHKVDIVPKKGREGDIEGPVHETQIDKQVLVVADLIIGDDRLAGTHCCVTSTLPWNSM
jgi:hypothetical protein